MEGKTYLDSSMAGKVVNRVVDQTMPLTVSTITESLSEQEQAILRLVARGLNNSDIANQMHLSKGAVQHYISSIFDKLDVADRIQAAIISLRFGLVDLRELYRLKMIDSDLFVRCVQI